MSQKKSKGSPSLHSIKSLPVDFSFVGSPGNDRMMAPDSTLGNGASSLTEADEGYANGNDNVYRNNESPYSRWTEDRPSVGDEGEDLNVLSSLKSFGRSPVDSKWSDTAPYAAKKKLTSWFQLPDGNWELGTILPTSGNEKLISLAEGKVLTVNSENLVPANPEILDGVDDLMQLSYLNEPSVLYNLQYRYNRDMIYTKAGPVLVAVNPFKKVPLYGNDYIEAYKSKSVKSPHVYAITDTAMQEMIRVGKVELAKQKQRR